MKYIIYIMSDSVINFYSKLENSHKSTHPKTWKNHHIYHNSMILCIGGTGTGKTNSLIDYLSRSSGEFHKIIICSFSTLDEPLYNFLQEKNDKIEFVNDVEEIPTLAEFDDETKNKAKSIIFDDFINLTKKEFKKINPFLISGRKYGFTVWLMAQEYTSIPKIITRNINYFILNRINDNIIITRSYEIIKNICNLHNYCKSNNNYLDIVLYNFLKEFNIPYKFHHINYKKNLYKIFFKN